MELNADEMMRVIDSPRGCARMDDVENISGVNMIYRLLHKLLNFLIEITSKYHNFDLVIYAVLCKYTCL